MLELMDNINSENKDDVNLRFRTFGGKEFRFDRKDPYGMIEIKQTDGYVPKDLEGVYTSWTQAYRAAETYALARVKAEKEVTEEKKVDPKKRQLPKADAALEK